MDYVNYYIRKLTNDGDIPPIGIVLCADKGDYIVKYKLLEKNHYKDGCKLMPLELLLVDELEKVRVCVLRTGSRPASDIHVHFMIYCNIVRRSVFLEMNKVLIKSCPNLLLLLFLEKNKEGCMTRIPEGLKHRPVMGIEDYEAVDGKYAGESDAKCMTLGLSQWDKNDNSLKVMRKKERWSAQSEELPLHRVLDGALLITKVLKDGVKSNNISLENQDVKVVLIKDRLTGDEKYHKDLETEKFKKNMDVERNLLMERARNLYKELQTLFN